MVEALDAEREVLFPNQPNHQTASLNCYPWRLVQADDRGSHLAEFHGVSRSFPNGAFVDNVSYTPRRSTKIQEALNESKGKN